MEITFKDEIFGCNIISPFQKLICILNPNLMNFEGFKYERLKFFFYVKSNELIFKIICRVPQSLYFL